MASSLCALARRPAAAAAAPGGPYCTMFVRWRQRKKWENVNHTWYNAEKMESLQLAPTHPALEAVRKVPPITATLLNNRRRVERLVFPEDLLLRTFLQRNPVFRLEVQPPFFRPQFQEGPTVAQQFAQSWQKLIETEGLSEDEAYQRTLEKFAEPMRRFAQRVDPKGRPAFSVDVENFEYVWNDMRARYNIAQQLRQGMADPTKLQASRTAEMLAPPPEGGVTRRISHFRQPRALSLREQAELNLLNRNLESARANLLRYLPKLYQEQMKRQAEANRQAMDIFHGRNVTLIPKDEDGTETATGLLDSKVDEDAPAPPPIAHRSPRGGDAEKPASDYESFEHMLRHEELADVLQLLDVVRDGLTQPSIPPTFPRIPRKGEDPELDGLIEKARVAQQSAEAWYQGNLSSVPRVPENVLGYDYYAKPIHVGWRVPPPPIPEGASNLRLLRFIEDVSKKPQPRTRHPVLSDGNQRAALGMRLAWYKRKAMLQRRVVGSRTGKLGPPLRPVDISAIQLDKIGVKSNGRVTKYEHRGAAADA